MASLSPPAQSGTPHRTPTPVRYMDTTAAYDLWSGVYDTDGNFLQALDTIEMKKLLPKVLDQIKSSAPKLVDLGCGTGRNTLKLLHVPRSTVIGLDASPKMLEIAKTRGEKELSGLSRESRASEMIMEVFDILQSPTVPPAASDSDLVVSTLVLEHVPIDAFFVAAGKMLKPGGLFIITNMHSEMGNISQAGFVDPKTGEKIRPQSYAHRIEDVIQAAKKQSFEVMGEIIERGVDEAMSEKLGTRAKKWIGIMVWFGLCFQKSI